MRVGGKAAFDAALRGENGGFDGETFLKAGELFKQLVDLQPFQNGFLGFKNPQAVGYFGDGKAAMTLAISTVYQLQRALAADKDGLERRQARLVRLPCRVRRQGRSDRHARRHHRLAGHQGRAEGGRRVPQVLHLEGRADAARRRQLSHPVVKGAEAGLTNPFMSSIADNLAPSNYHQNFYDQASAPRSGASSTTSPPRSPAAA